MQLRCRFNLMLAAMTVVAIGIAMPQVVSAQAVDLRGKQEVPRDLKKDNPPERSLKIKEPPSPPREAKPKAEKAPYGVGPTAGGLPPADKGGAAVRVIPKPIPR